MKTETILNKLLKLKEDSYNSELLDNVINELKMDVYNDNGSDYIVVRGYKVPLNECIRFGTMWA